MEKKIEDYIHLYPNAYAWLIRTDSDTVIGGTIKELLATHNNSSIERITPHIRPISDMTEEEYATMLIIANKNNIKILERDEIVLRQTAPEIMLWLLSKGFDLFGLIENNLAIDKTTIK